MSQEHGWSDDGVTLLGRSFEKTEHVFARAAFGFVLLFVCSVLSLGVVAVVTPSDSPDGAVWMVGVAGLVGSFASVAGIGVTCLGFGCWSYRHSRRVRASLDVSVETPLGNPLWLVALFFRSSGTLDEYEWWVRRACWWSLFGLGWLVPVAKVALDRLG